MELGNADQEELEKTGFFTPITPFKCISAATEFNSINAGLNNFWSTNSSYNSQKKDEEVSDVIGGRSEFLSRHLDGGSESATVAPSTPMTKANPRKKQCGSVDMNERPLKKPRMRKHTPKIFDESKPKKTPKPKIKPSIPKSGNSKVSAKIKKKIEKDHDKVSVDLSGDAYMQTPNSKIPETIPGSLVLQVSTPQPETLEHALSAISPPDFEHDNLTDFGHVSKSCKRSLPFNLENENDFLSIEAAEVIRYHVTQSYNKFLTNPLDGFNEQAVDTNSSIGLEDNLEAESQPNQGNDPSIYQDDQRACQHHFLKVYERRKTQIDLMPLAGNEAHVYPNNHGTISACRDHSVKVYKRRTIGNTGAVPLAGNETTSQNDHKSQEKGGSRLDFLESYRTSNNIGTADYADKGWNPLDTNTKSKVTSKSSFTICKRVTRRDFEIVNGAKNTCFSNMKSGQKGKFRSHFVVMVLPNKNQIAAAMADIESFECVFSLSPMVKSRRRRLIHPKRTKSAHREEYTKLEPLPLSARREENTELGPILPMNALTLSPLVTSKRKRSKNCKRSTAILDPLCLKSGLSAINGFESFVDKWSQISACNEIQECSQHEGLWPQTDKSGCNDIEECPQHEDLLPRTNKSTCSEIQEYTQHENLLPKTKRSTKIITVAAIIRIFKKIKICDTRTYKKKTTTSNNNDQLVLWNPDGSMIVQNPKAKELPRVNDDQLFLRNPDGSMIVQKRKAKKLPKVNDDQLVLRNLDGSMIVQKRKAKELPKVDLDSESERVWEQLIENGGIDEDPDEKKNIWWKEQRELFKGRADSFIARMCLVLGKRTFSPWKGSVVDSVVGVFLTQNVSDYLSSNAFMLLASAFPLQNSREMTTQQEQALAITHVLPDSDEIFVSNTSESMQEENIGNQNTCGSQSSANCGNPEVISFAKSCDLVNETGDLPDEMSREKNKLPKREFDWDRLRKAYSTGTYTGSTESNRDSVNWEAVRHADVKMIFEQIKCRGQGNVLAAKIKNFLNRSFEHHGSVDLEWLRDVPKEDVKEYLLSIYGLGPKSTDCIRLLSLRHHSFPVDINVARIVVRLGWVPLQPLPDGLQMHLLEKFPLESSIQKYLWPRLCELDVSTLYELHYHMITFGKVFCTKKKPNCDACPLRTECRHFASAFASTRLRLPGPQQKGEADSKQPDTVDDVLNMCVSLPNLPHSSESFSHSSFQTQHYEPIVEMPESPEHRPLELLEQDIEDFSYEAEHEQEIPTIKLNTKAFGENILSFIDKSNKDFKEIVLSFIDEISKLQSDEEVSKALVLLNPKSAACPARKLKTETRLRTEHLVYELPDDHPLLSGFEKREPDDDCPYLLAISQTEQVVHKQEKNGKDSSSNELEKCSDNTNYFPKDEIIYGTILIPCRTANRGSFPLNGTYFQINEVFADHESSLNPIPVARASIWNLRVTTLYCGTSVSSIVKGLSTMDIQKCFWKGFMVVRGYDRKQRAPRPLHARFHRKGNIEKFDDE
ncbi:DNA glycosylase/AP lyase ROS1 isoform X1 [Solanum lycopersicum]|nr:protein ROS1-like isoform X1 [Solanum lycopersicum]XP_010318463.1 protein ROS1-like isoform X1 [Solanum lycopersicum]